MKRARMFSSLIAVSSALLLVVSFASCATNAEDNPTETDASTSIPEASAPLPDVVDAGSIEAGCDASDSECVTELASCAEVDWCLVPTPATPTHGLAAVWGAAADDIWAAGSGGTILHYDGKAWTTTPTGVHNTFYALWGSGPHDIWVASTTDVILHGRGFENGAPTPWENVPAGAVVEPDFENGYLSTTAGSLMVRALWGTSAEDVHVGTRFFSIEAYVPDPLPADGIADEFFFIGSGNYFVKSSADAGPAWRPFPGRLTVRSIWGASANDVWMTSDADGPYGRGTILHGTPHDAGSPAPGLAPAADLCVGCEPGCTSCKLLDDPIEWTPTDSQSKLAFEAVWGSSASDVWAVGEGGTIRRFKTGDVRWGKVESETTKTLHAVWGSGPNDVWIVGDGGTILHFDGVAFRTSSVQLPLGRRANLRGVWGSGPNDVWIVGDGVVLHFTGPKAGGGK